MPDFIGQVRLKADNSSGATQEDAFESRADKASDGTTRKPPCVHYKLISMEVRLDETELAVAEVGRGCVI
jgi:hypothetical protein